MSKRKGVTLIELVLTAALIGLVLQVVYSLFFVGAASYSVSTNKGFSQQDIRIAADYIKSELKYSTDISDDNTYINDYYSLEVQADGNKKYLIKTFHEAVDNSGTITIVPQEVFRLQGNWESIQIKNTAPGVIDVLMTQTEKQGFKESSFELPFEIRTINNYNLNENLSIDLVDSEIIYYRNLLPSLLNRGIDIPSSESGSDLGEQVTISFNSDRDSLINQIIASSGEYIDMPANPTRSGKTFAGWYTELSGGGEYYPGPKMLVPNTDLTLYAKWVDTLVQVGIDNYVKNATNNSLLSTSGEYFRIAKNTTSFLKVYLSGYTSGHAGLVTATVAGTTGVIESDYSLAFSVTPPNGENKIVEIEIIIKTSGYPPVSRVFKFMTD